MDDGGGGAGHRVHGTLANKATERPKRACTRPPIGATRSRNTLHKRVAKPWLQWLHQLNMLHRGSSFLFFFFFARLFPQQLSVWGRLMGLAPGPTHRIVARIMQGCPKISAQKRGTYSSGIAVGKLSIVLADRTHPRRCVVCPPLNGF